jgi:peptidoglycan/LPS O-acetylase OafA/YrhL
VNYLDLRYYPSVMSWAWSLCVEEHFYLLLPLALYVTYRLPQRARLYAIVSFVFIPFLARLVWFAADPSRSLMDHYYYYSHFRFDEIFVGVLLGYLSVVHSERLLHWVRRVDAWLIPVALTAIGSVWIFGGLISSNAFSIVFQFSIMASGSGLILLKSTLTKGRTTTFFSHPLWYPLARISYGTYLIHPYILFGLIQFWAGGQFEGIDGVDFLMLSTAVMTLSSIVAAVMFVVLEAPLLRIGMRVSLSLRGER